MKFEISGKDAFLPQKEIYRAADGAGESELKVLLLLLSHAEDRVIDTDACRDKILEALEIDEAEFLSAIAYWRGAKVIKTKKEASKKKEENKKHLLEDKLPDYSEDEMAVKIESTKGLKRVIDECQQIIGKIFSPADVAVIVGMSDRLSLSGEFITMLTAYVSGTGKKSLRYLEKTACAIYDEGVDTPEKLAEYISKKESAHEMRTAVKKMIGAGDRELTAKEKDALDKWVYEYGYDIDVIRIAYEMTASRIKGPGYIPYMGAIIDSWYKKGLKSTDDINGMLEAYKNSKSESVGGFDTDDFFEKAVNKTKKNKMKKED
jgi:DnaD/phage-associated family protein